VYELLVWEFTSSLVVDLKRVLKGDVGYIRFQLFNKTFELNLACFNALFQLPNHGALAPCQDDYKQGSFLIHHYLFRSLIWRPGY